MCSLLKQGANPPKTSIASEIPSGTSQRYPLLSKLPAQSRHSPAQNSQDRGAIFPPNAHTQSKPPIHYAGDVPARPDEPGPARKLLHSSAALAVPSRQARASGATHPHAAPDHPIINHNVVSVRALVKQQ